MTKKIFVSYSHTDGNWVWSDLKPCLDAGGATVLIDEDRFVPGPNVYHQMDDLQDQADLHLLVLSTEYFKSDPCRHEMERALAADPEFRNGKVILVRRDDAAWPDPLTRHRPLYVKLARNGSGYGTPKSWADLLAACKAKLGACATRWLAARDEIIQLAGRRENICLHVDKGVRWRPLLDQLQRVRLPLPLLPDLKIVDLEDGRTASRPGLLRQILDAFGHGTQLPPKPGDLVAFSHAIEAMNYGRLSLVHFDYVATPERQEEYGINLFSTLRHLITEPKKKLGLLAVSHAPFGALLPVWNPLSDLDVKTVRLEAAP